MNIGKKTSSQKLIIPFIVTLLATILLASTIFMPYATATESFSDRIENYSDDVKDPTTGMTMKDVKSISMFEYMQVYLNLGSVYIIYVVFVVLIGVFVLLAILFAALKKAIPVIVFDILAFGLFLIQNWDYTDRGVVPSANYDWGIAYYLFFVAAIVVLAGAIWMIVCKAKAKKEVTAE